jgi:hypothetical protein
MRLHILGEGFTEKRFVENVLTGHLIKYNIITDVCCFITKFIPATGQQFKGGISNYAKIKKDILNRISEDNNKDSVFTTMIDFYGIPDDFPGVYAKSEAKRPYEKVKIIENALADDINDSRFIPYIQLHEFESLIFSDPLKLAKVYIDFKNEIRELQELSNSIPPEEINDGFASSPSHRIKKVIPPYDKAFAGGEIAKAIGIEVMRKKCPHFNEWITKLDKLGMNEHNTVFSESRE